MKMFAFIKSLIKKQKINSVDKFDKYRGDFGTVLETIDNNNNVGLVLVDDNTVQARSENDEVIKKGTKVVITNIIDEKVFVVEYNI